ncbi:MAG: fibronectin type III domain-containing protein, partial [Candidatus Kerfeldbacteria bacterium]|nr:fibronectin type III domain-containing protein [Candidatus Kerfeldbacteria bacterium]
MRIAVTLGVVLSLFTSSLQTLLLPLTAQAFSNSWTFDTAGDYTYDNTKIKVTSGQAQSLRTPDWWDTNYAYRKRITVTAGSTAITTSNTMTVKTDVAALITAGKVQNEADPDDLRVVYWNGTTNTNIDREYVSTGLDETINSGTDQNDIRFKAQAAISASGSDNGYYVYYGYGSATAGPKSPANIYQYYQDFSTDVLGAGTWVEANSARWSVTGGRMSHDSTNAGNEYAVDKTTTFSPASSWYFEVTGRRTSATNTTSIGMSNMTTNDANPTAGWRAGAFSSATDVEFWIAEGAKISDGTGTFSAAQNTDYRYSLRHIANASCGANWSTIAVWIEGTKYNQANIGATNCPTTLNPTVHQWNATGTFDDYKVWQYLNESIALGSEETTYPNDSPTITPTTSLSFTTLSSFSQTATLNGGSIGYILSNDGGTSWLYHNGSNWVASDGTVSQSTTAANINTNISTFPVGSASFLFRAFLTSNGTQLVQLDTVALNGNVLPTTPTLSSPADASAVTVVKPTLQLSTTDTESDYIRYKIQLDTVNTFGSGNLQTFDQTATQTGWSGQDAQSASAYASGSAASYTLQSALTPAATYYWRAAAIDPGGANTFSGYSSIRSFTTPALLAASSFTASSIGITTATVTWSTTTAATTTIEYGTTVSYGTTTTVSGTRTSHSVSITGLSANTTYHYRVSGTDASGQSVTSSDQTFSTLADNGLTNLQVASITTTSAVITWATSNASGTTVDYGTSTSYGSTATVAGSVTSHSVSLNGLTPATVYHYRVSSTDGNGITATSTDQTFTTLTPTLITNVLVTKLEATSVGVTWTTNHAADSKVRYGTSTDYGLEVSESTLV